MALYILIAYFAFSMIFYLYLYRKFYFKEKRLNEKINELTPSPEPLKLESDKIEEKTEKIESVEEHQNINLDKIENPDKDKPFAKISSASAIETAEFEQQKEEEKPIKPKRKYNKRTKV